MTFRRALRVLTGMLLTSGVIAGGVVLLQNKELSEMELRAQTAQQDCTGNFGPYGNRTCTCTSGVCHYSFIEGAELIYCPAGQFPLIRNYLEWRGDPNTPGTPSANCGACNSYNAAYPQPVTRTAGQGQGSGNGYNLVQCGDFFWESVKTMTYDVYCTDTSVAQTYCCRKAGDPLGEIQCSGLDSACGNGICPESGATCTSWLAPNAECDDHDNIDTNDCSNSCKIQTDITVNVSATPTGKWDQNASGAFSITVSNSTSVIAKAVSVTLSLPNMTITSAVQGSSADCTSGTCVLGDIAAGLSKSFGVNITHQPQSCTPSNNPDAILTASATTTTVEPDITDNTASTNVGFNCTFCGDNTVQAPNNGQVNEQCDGGANCTNSCMCPAGMSTIGNGCGTCNTNADCNDSNLCTNDVCNTTNHTCTNLPTTIAGSCMPIVAPNDQCATNACNPSTGQCAVTIKNDNGLCGNPLHCMTDVCRSGTCTANQANPNCICAIQDGAPITAFNGKPLAATVELNPNKKAASLIANGGQCFMDENEDCNFANSCNRVHYTNRWDGPDCCTVGYADLILDADPGKDYATINYFDVCNGAGTGTRRVPVCPCNTSSAASSTPVTPSSSSRTSSSNSSRSSSSSSSSRTSSSSSSSFRCTSDLQCPADQYCNNGTCTDGCRTDADCSIGKCVNHQCVPCGNDNECPAGQVCTNGQCTVRSSSSSSRTSSSSSRISSSTSSSRSSSSSSISSSSVSTVASNYCCIAGSCTQFAGCSLTLNACTASCTRSSSSSSRSTSSVSSVTLVAGVCYSDECSIGGDALCASRGQQCVTNSTFPCVSCQAISCTNDNQCPVGSICLNGTCALGCTDDNQCGAGQICEAGRCIAGCASDDQCAAGQACLHGRCVLNGCGSDVDCPAGFICRNNQCVNGCRDDIECPQGQYCDAGTCTQGCRNDLDCSVGRCIDHRCVPCGNDKECKAGEKCVNGACMLASPFALSQICGNGILEKGEQCDEGVANADTSNAACRTNCTFSKCGDGIVDLASETCDAGSRNGVVDGECDSRCQVVHRAPEVLPGTVIELPFSPSQSVDITPIVSPQPPANTDSGPGTIAIMAAGAAGGYALIRRRQKAK